MNLNMGIDPISPRQPWYIYIRPLLEKIREEPYSAFATNVILVVLAIAIIITSITFGWIASNPEKFRTLIRELRNIPRLARLEARYKKWVKFLIDRLKPEGAYGLSFTIGLAALGLSIWAFGSVLEDVVAKNELIFFDMPLAAFIADHRIPWFTEIMRYVTLLGNGWFVISLACVTGFSLWYKTKSWRPFLLLVTAIAGAGILDLILKIAVSRPRPPVALMVAPLTGYSFPSGHTSLSAIYGAIAYLLAKNLRRRQGKAFIWIIALVLAFLIGVSRVYLGAHWLTDVLGGWTLASLWLSIVFTTASVIEKIRRPAQILIKTVPPVSYPAGISPFTAPEHLTPADEGLNEDEVKDRTDRGQVNTIKKPASRSAIGIFKENIFTRFNALLGSLLILILMVGPSQDALFGIVIILNTAIGIIQELRAKWTLDRLVIITAPKARVVRSREIREIAAGKIVVDDVIELHSGDQVPVDGVVLTSNNTEINESSLTGESEPVSKNTGDKVYSGTFVIAGSCRIQAVRVGYQSYAQGLTDAARQFTLSRSELRKGINRILRYITWFLVPTSVILFITQLLYMQSGWRDAIAGSVAGVVGMVPEGLVLLASVVMAAAVVRLARRHALIQDLAAVEVLARIDVLCLDKTGTLTEGKMFLEKIIPANHIIGATAYVPPCNPRDILGAMAKEEPSPNASLIAIASECPSPQGTEWAVKNTIPFSSARKWSAITFEKYGSWILGAPEVVLSRLEDTSPLFAEIDWQTKIGKRVLALAHTEEELPHGSQSISLPPLTPAALVILGEHIRKDVVQTLQYFKDQGVSVKIISGDNPHTVASIATSAGITCAELCLDGRDLPTDTEALAAEVERTNVFGRVAPEQKRLVISALRRNGHAVAMIGDGVNDILAIKEADLGVAMGSGTGACRAIAQLVLLSDNFSVLPDVIAEGRRVIGNIERTANLFISKTTYVFALAWAVGVAMVPFPFLPRHLTLIGFLTIGTPGLFLSLSRNVSRAQRGFISRVLRFSIPAGGIAAAMTLISYALVRQIGPANVELARSASTLTLIGCGFSILILLARPLTLLRKLFIASMLIALGLIMAVSSIRGFFALVFPPLHVWAIIVILVGTCFSIIRMVRLKLTS